MFDRKRVLQQSAKRVSKSRVESRDAIIWQVLAEQRICTIKIQGSTNLLYARYPQNWESTPQYIKAGNAVRVAHRGGNQGILEIVGHGRSIPTISGVERPAPVDAPITGLDVLAVYGEMQVTVTPGSYRLSGITYTTDSDPVATVSFTAPSAGYWRYDILVIGSDMVVDKINGTPSTTNPTLPSTPSDHVKIGHVLLYGGMTSISESDINRSWQESKPNSLSTTDYNVEMDWETNSIVIPITVKDQAMISMAGNWQIKATIESGGGSLNSGSQETTRTLSTSNTASVNFTLYRLAPSSDTSCRIKFELIGYEQKVYTYVFVAMFDELGEIII